MKFLKTFFLECKTNKFAKRKRETKKHQKKVELNLLMIDSLTLLEKMMQERREVFSSCCKHLSLESTINNTDFIGENNE